jgi:hypothetical protein
MLTSFREAIQQPEYVHLLLNHLPLTGLFVAVLCLAGSLVTGNRAGLFLGLGLVSLFALAAWPVSEYGEGGFDRVLSMADTDGAAYLKHHRALAERWVWLYYVTATLGVLGIVAGWKRPRWLRAVAVTVAIFALGSLLGGATVAECGGKVRHPEFRTGPPPADSQPNADLSFVYLGDA